MVNRRASRKPSSSSFWLYSRWVVLNAVVGAGAIGIPVLAAWAFATRITGTAPLPNSALIGVGIVAAIIGTVLCGIFVGSAQWWLVRHRITGLPLGKWNAALTAGVAIAWIGLVAAIEFLQFTSVTPWRITNGVPPPALWVLCTGLLIGITTALPQALLLRQYVDQALWWLYGNALGWVFAVMTLLAVFPLIPVKGTKQIVGAIAAGSFVLALIVAAVNGLFLAIMLSVVRNTGLRPSDHDMYVRKPRKRRASTGAGRSGQRKSELVPAVARPTPPRGAPNPSAPSLSVSASVLTAQAATAQGGANDAVIKPALAASAAVAPLKLAPQKSISATAPVQSIGKRTRASTMIELAGLRLTQSGGRSASGGA